jgi:HD-like signal output (HDOD) protein
MLSPTGRKTDHQVKSNEEREAKVEARINLIRAQGDFPALSDQIREVMTVSQDEDAALDRLADLVLKNYGLTLRVLRTVNSIHYNRSGQPILSVARAIVLLGVRTVREMAASFLIVDHYQRRSPELKRLMILSMVTASHAESLSAWNPKVRPDEAYVCGMFRNLGEVLVANHFPDDYARITALAETERVGPAEMALRVLGFSF